MVGRADAEAAFDPALEHRALGAVAVVAPALDEPQEGGAEALAVGAFLLLLRVDAEHRHHVEGKGFPGLLQIAGLGQHVEQAAVHLAHAPNAERRRIFIEIAAREEVRRPPHEIGRMSYAVPPLHTHPFNKPEWRPLFNGVQAWRGVLRHSVILSFSSSGCSQRRPRCAEGGCGRGHGHSFRLQPRRWPCIRFPGSRALPGRPHRFHQPQQPQTEGHVRTVPSPVQLMQPGPGCLVTAVPAPATNAAGGPRNSHRLARR